MKSVSTHLDRRPLPHRDNPFIEHPPPGSVIVRLADAESGPELANCVAYFDGDAPGTRPISFLASALVRMEGNDPIEVELTRYRLVPGSFPMAVAYYVQRAPLLDAGPLRPRHLEEPPME